MTSLNELTLTQARDALAKGETSSAELTSAHIAAAEAARPLNAFVTETFEHAADMAKASDARRKSGEAGIVERFLQRPDAEVVIVVFGQLAVAGIANARDGVFATERLFRHRSHRAWVFSTVS